jgi:hypothetical protein
VGASPEPPPPDRGPDLYDEDRLTTEHNHQFTRDPDFIRAYERGVRAEGTDHRWRWRVHMGLWAAATASRLPGDFVECGVNRGFLSSAIMESLEWDRLGKTFWLLDTFAGVDESMLSPQELAVVREHNRRLPDGYYVDGAASVIANFAEWSNVRIIEGSVPGTLAGVQSEQVAYLHIDMNSTVPEIAALDHFWPILVPGAVVLLDDYAYFSFELQYAAVNAWAAERDVAVASLPTGQGLIIRPPG